MKHTFGCKDLTMKAIPIIGSLLLVASTACHPPLAQAQLTDRAAPDLSIGAAQFPDEDGIILRWEQDWTVDRDGTVHRRDHMWFKFLSRRPIRRVADPRLDFVHGQDELIIHTAQTHLPDGTILPVADYSFNYAGPDDVAGWPEYTDWQQMVICFGGIENNAIIELDYEVVTPAGVLPWIDADLRLHDDYPTVDHVVSVTLPEGTPIHHKVDRVAPSEVRLHESTANGSVTYRWAFANLPGSPDEQQSRPWQERSGRLRFSACPSAARWVSAMLERVDRAGQPSGSIKKFAESAIEEEADTLQQVHKIAKKIHDSFNIVTSPKTMRSLRCRPAADVLLANYGNPLESAGLLLATLRSMDMKASASVGVDATCWDESGGLPPTESAFAGVAVRVDLQRGPVWVHPEHGVFQNPGTWGRHWLLGVDDTGKLQSAYVYARGENDPSELDMIGKIAIDEDAKATGELRIRAIGTFFDPAKLETADAQEKQIKNLVGRVLSDVDVPGHSVSTLSQEVFRAMASIASKDSIKELNKLHLLKLGDGPAFLPEIPLPLDRSYRQTDVQLNGRFHERIDLTIELPDGWQPFVLPAAMLPVRGSWGILEQSVEVRKKTIRFRRNVSVMTDLITPGDFESLGRAVNELKANRSLLLVVGESSESN